MVEKMPAHDQKINRPVDELLARPAEKSYLEEWTHFISTPEESENKQVMSIVVFRIRQEWFAFRTAFFKEVLEDRKIHIVPHMKTKGLRGVVNHLGQLRLCYALDQLLGVNAAIKTINDPHHFSRLIAVEKDGIEWIFAVDEIEGIRHVDVKSIETVPINISKSPENYIKGVLHLGGKSIGVLDDEMLFYSLNRRLM